MPTELQNPSQTAEPAAGGPESHPGVARRLLLGCTRWLVVFAFVATGYFGAAAVHAGLRHATPAPQQQILAASPAQD